MDWKSALEALETRTVQDDSTATNQTNSDADSNGTLDSLTQANAAMPNEKARLDIIFERKGRAGKQATIITGFTMSDEQIESLAATLKKRLGTGGSARGGEILIQGDRRRQVLDLLGTMGYRARII